MLIQLVLQAFILIAYSKQVDLEFNKGENGGMASSVNLNTDTLGRIIIGAPYGITD